MAETAASAPTSASLAPIALWPPDVLARHLSSDDPRARTVALGMAVQPGAPVDDCVSALVACARHSAGDPLASQLAATALGCLRPDCVTDEVQSSVAAFLEPEHELPVRVAAAHALFRLGCLPRAAHDPLCALLFDADPGARKAALLAFSRFATAAAGTLAPKIAATAPAAWTVEALQALVRSAGDDASSRSKVEGFLLRSLAGAPLVPAGIAGYAALARLDPKGAGLAALVRIAGEPADREASSAALDALGQLGETAQPAAKGLARTLAATDDPAREELLCRTLVQLRAAAVDLPQARIAQRVQSAPDRSAAAHCMLLCLHPKEFAQAAATVQQRFVAAGEGLQKVLAQTYQTLTGTGLAAPAAAGSA